MKATDPLPPGTGGVVRDCYVGDDALPMPFGKFKGKAMGWIADNHPEYLHWLVGVRIESAWLRDAIRRLHRRYADRMPRESP